MRYLITLFLLLLLQTNLYATDKVFKVNGCGITRNAFANELTNAFSQKYNIETTINKKGSVIKALIALKKGEADVATGCRLPLINTMPQEKDIWSVQVAWGALAFAVNDSNPIDNISTEQLKKILLGKITNWKDLGGEDSVINLYLRKGKNTGIGFSTRVLLFGDHQKSFYKNASRLNNSTQTRKLLKTDKNSFAIDDITSIRETQGIKVLTVDGYYPSKKNILEEKYKFGRPFYIYSNERPRGIVRQYIKFALSLEGQTLISNSGNLSLKEGKSSKNLNLLLMMLNP